jgi:hypothetical protein
MGFMALGMVASATAGYIDPVGTYLTAESMHALH